MTKETFLPLFPGFYGSMLECTNDEQEFDNINEQREARGLPAVGWDEVNFDYRDYEKKVGKNACNYVERILNGLGLKCSIEFQKIVSPREYNFENDNVDCKVKFNVATLRRLFKESECEKYLHDTFTSRDGFISFYSNQKSWWGKCKLDETTTGWIMGAILLFHPNTEWNEDDFNEAALRNALCRAVNYYGLLPEQTDDITVMG